MKGMMIKRYLDLLLYSVIAYLVLSYIGETFAWNEWLALRQKLQCTTCDALALHFPSQLVFASVGVIVTSLASYLQIYHPNRPLNPCLSFPPLTFSVGFAVLYWGFQSQQELPTLMTNSWGLIIGLLILPLLHFIISKCPKSATPQRTDLPKESLNELDPELQHSANLILKNIKGESQHIALCGAFGTGKTSVINAAIKLWEKDHQDQLIHCNIDLWGVATNSIVEFVLEQIMSALSEHLDVSGLRRLPANYLDAIKTSNTSLSFIASLLNKHESPDNVLKQFDDLLRLTGKTLIVTIQDIDRNEDAKSSMLELAGLLERLKQSVENIIYIFAAERTPEFSETIRRICPVRLDLAKPALKNKIESLHKELVDQLPKDYLSKFSAQEHTFAESESAMVADLLPCYRAFNELEKMVKEAWGNSEGGGLLIGEVYPHELILMYALKNEYPQIFDLLHLVHADGGENTLAALLGKYMPQTSESEKDLLVSVFKFFGLLNDSHLGLLRFSNIADVQSGGKEAINPLIVELTTVTPDALSVINADRKKLMLRGARSQTDFSHMDAYLLFHEIAGGNLDVVDTLISKVVHDGRDAWLSALSSYGIHIFFTSTQDFKLPQRIIFKFLSVPKASLSHSLMRTIDTTLQNSTKLPLKNSFISYLVSEQFCADALLWTQYVKASVLGDIILMLRRISVSGKDSDLHVVQAKSTTKKLVMGITNESSEQHIVLLISFFQELGNGWRYLEELIQEVLSVEDLDLIELKLKSVDPNSSSLLGAYQKLYPEYDFIESDNLNRGYDAAITVLKRLRTRPN